MTANHNTDWEYAVFLATFARQLEPSCHEARVQAYQRQAQLNERRRQEEMVKKYAPLVKKVAYRMVHRLPSSVEVEDLISVGTIGLLQAFENFDDKSTKFQSFAEFRIKGAMLDELRTYDYIRAARGKANKVEKARQPWRRT